jgi:hypothetical protein
MSASVIFMIFLIVVAGIVGVIAVGFERKRVRDNASPDRIPRRFWRRRSDIERDLRTHKHRSDATLPLDDDPVDAAAVAEDYPHEEFPHESEAEYERTRRLPDGSRGGRFQED